MHIALSLNTSSAYNEAVPAYLALFFFLPLDLDVDLGRHGLQFSQQVKTAFPSLFT